MEFGVFDHMDTSGTPLAMHMQNRLSLVELYDRCGFYGYHVAEHHGTPLGFAPSPNLYFAAVAQRTRTMRFGPLVYLLPLYHPLRLIEEIAMLDQMSGGRLLLGVGRGVSPIELGFYGVDFAQSQSMYAEALECVLRGLQQETLTFEGEHYRFTDVPMTIHPLQKPHPELWYGALSPDTMVWAAANDVNIVTIALDEGARLIVDRYKAEWVKLGKSLADLPKIGITRHVVIAETDQEARAIARRAYRKWHDSFTHLWRQAGMEVPFVSTLYPPEWDDLQAVGNGYAGSPETVKRLVAEEVEKTGINYLLSGFAFGDTSVAEVTRSVESFAQVVMPAFAGSRSEAAA